MKDFFQDLKVVELSSVLAGPAVGMFFAELGAEVIKIENKKTGGDVTRKWKLSSESKDSTVSAYFASVNYGKEHVFLDLSNPEDKEVLFGYIKKADVVTSNFKGGDAEKFGLTYQALSRIKKDLINCHLYGYDLDKSRPAYDAVLQAETGFMHMNGEPDSPPLKMPLALIDILAAHQMKEAILMALLKREKTGEGSKIEVSLERSAIATLANQATNWLMCGHNPAKIGSLHPNIAPYGETYLCADGNWLVLAIGSDLQFARMTKVIGKEELASDERFATNKLRVEHRVAMGSVLKDAFLNFNRDEVVELLINSNIPAGAVNSMKEVFATETGKAMVLEEELEGVRTLRPSSLGFNFRED